MKRILSCIVLLAVLTFLNFGLSPSFPKQSAPTAQKISPAERLSQAIDSTKISFSPSFENRVLFERTGPEINRENPVLKTRLLNPQRSDLKAKNFVSRPSADSEQMLRRYIDLREQNTARTPGASNPKSKFALNPEIVSLE